MTKTQAQRTFEAAAKAQRTAFAGGWGVMGARFRQMAVLEYAMQMICARDYESSSKTAAELQTEIFEIRRMIGEME